MADELPFHVETLEDAPEAYRALYVEQEGGGFALPVAGAVPKQKLDEFRTNNIHLMRQLDELRGKLKPYEDLDLEQYHQILQERQATQDKKMIDEGKVEELFEQRTARLKQDHDTAFKAVEQERDQLKQTLSRELITNRLQQAAVAANVRKEALEDVTLLGERVFQVQDGQVVAVDPQTRQPLYGKDGQPMTMAEWLAEREQDRPHWFQASSGGGAPPGGGNSTNGRGGAAGTKSRAQMSAQEAARYIGEHGQDAYLDLPA